jgi:hypothetical protein
VQTFLPYPDFAASAAVLDTKRLGKQRVETVQVLRGLTLPTYGWRHHPAVNDVFLTLVGASNALSDVQRRLDLEFRASYPDHVSNFPLPLPLPPP